MLHIPTSTQNATNQPPRQYRRRGRRVRNGRNAAAFRALTAASHYLADGGSLSDTAEGHGVSILYVRAAITVLKADDTTLIEKALHGYTSILDAAKSVERTVRMAEAFRKGSTAERIRFAQTIGTETLFEVVVAAS